MKMIRFTVKHLDDDDLAQKMEGDPPSFTVSHPSCFDSFFANPLTDLTLLDGIDSITRDISRTDFPAPHSHLRSQISELEMFREFLFGLTATINAMALRTFCSNPCLGGFGGESSIVSSIEESANGTRAGGIEKEGVAVVQQDCDAFGQIIKELVDNAVDACCDQKSSIDEEKSVPIELKRVRVVIEQVKNSDSSSQQLLKVTVSDNGCGMKRIEECVEAFRTSKAGSTSSNDQEMTAGRYGIGLTLCLLHAQRLVPNSCASITSAPASASQFTRASYVVDMKGDSIRCVKREQLPKNFSEESGTSVSLLVPGGETAHQAWPRLAEYFARFQLSLGLRCSVEVMAPCLSALPLFVRPSFQQLSKKAAQKTNDIYQDNKTPVKDIADHGKKHLWTDGISDDEYVNKLKHIKAVYDDSDHDVEGGARIAGANQTKDNAVESDYEYRKELLVAASNYLKRPVKLKNVARSIQPIRCNGEFDRGVDRPMLEVDMIVCGPDQNEAEDDDDVESHSENTFETAPIVSPTARLMLVRMVNKIPLLDGAEASACGLVQGLCSKQAIWTSFGLHVSFLSKRHGTNSDNQNLVVNSEQDVDITNHLFAPTYSVRDSDQVAPFFQTSTHTLFDMGDTEQNFINDSDTDDDDEDILKKEEGGASTQGWKRGRTKQRALLPAHLRLGNILVITQIHATPSCLPLPTLSKGRLPLNEKAIDDALELGLSSCLRSLQKTSPELLLTAQQLKQTERDTRYCPAVAAAIASIAYKSDDAEFQTTILKSVRAWGVITPNQKESVHTEKYDSKDVFSEGIMMPLPEKTVIDARFESFALYPDSDPILGLATLGTIVEERLRLICSNDGKPKKKANDGITQKTKKNRRGKNNPTKDSGVDSNVDLDGFLQTQESGELSCESPMATVDDSPPCSNNYDQKVLEDADEYDTDASWW